MLFVLTAKKKHLVKFLSHEYLYLTHVEMNPLHALILMMLKYLINLFRME